MDKLVKTSLMVLFLTCSTILSAQTGKTTLKIVHYNVGVFSKEIENSIPMIAGMMKELDADVISLNELDSCNLRHDTYQLRDFAEEMGGWDYRFVNALPYKGGAYGVGVCSRDRIISSGEIHLDRYDGSETRACCIVETEKYVLATTHLDYKTPGSSLNQARDLNSELKARYGNSGKPVFLCGDINTRPDSETIAEFRKEWTQLSGTDFTISAKNPKGCIDYVFLLNNGVKCKVRHYEVPMTFENGGDVTVASDHLPVFVEVEF